MRKNFGKILMAVIMLSVVAVACNNKKDKKDDAPKDDTTVVQPAPEPMPAGPDSTGKPGGGDTLDTRPVKPGE